MELASIEKPTPLSKPAKDTFNIPKNERTKNILAKEVNNVTLKCLIIIAPMFFSLVSIIYISLKLVAS